MPKVECRFSARERAAVLGDLPHSKGLDEISYVLYNRFILYVSCSTLLRNKGRRAETISTETPGKAKRERPKMFVRSAEFSRILSFISHSAFLLVCILLYFSCSLHDSISTTIVSSFAGHSVNAWVEIG